MPPSWLAFGTYWEKGASRTTTPPACAAGSPASQVVTSVEEKETVQRQIAPNSVIVLEKNLFTLIRRMCAGLLGSALSSHRHSSPLLTFAHLFLELSPVPEVSSRSLRSDVLLCGLHELLQPVALLEFSGTNCQRYLASRTKTARQGVQCPLVIRVLKRA